MALRFGRAFGAARVAAYTTVERVSQRSGDCFYNTRAIRRLGHERDVAAIVDGLAGDRLWAEVWVPKATMGSRSFDVRILAIAGRAAHGLLRLAATPITNLHLGSTRAPVEVLEQRLPPAARIALDASIEATARVFPRALHLGIDVAFTPSLERHVVLEVNAFGDLLPGARHCGRDTYHAEVAMTPEWLGTCHAGAVG